MPQDDEIAVKCDHCDTTTTGDKSIVGAPCLCGNGHFQKVEEPAAPVEEAAPAGEGPATRILEPGRVSQPTEKATLFVVAVWEDGWKHKGTKATEQEANSVAEQHRDKWTVVSPVKIGL